MAPKRAPPPPPSGMAPVSQEVVQIIKKKLAAPTGRPPAGMENFKMPKHLSPALQRKNGNDDDYDDDSEQNSPNNDRYRDYRDDNDDYDNKKYNNSYDDNDYIDGDDDDWNRDNNRRRHNKSATYDNDRGPGSKARGTDDSISFTADSRDSIEKTKVVENKQHNADAKIDNNNKKKAVVFSFTPILKATYRELRSFITGPCPNGFVTRCYIERNRSGSNMLSPVYSLCADLEDGTGRELAVCRKVIMSSSSYYVFSLKSEDLYRKREQRSRLYLGKLRATSSNEYILYDNGVERTTEHGVSDDEDDDGAKGTGDKKGEEKTSDENTKYRKELLCIYFNTKTRPGISVAIFIIIIIIIVIIIIIISAPPKVRGLEVCLPYIDSTLPVNSQTLPSSLRNQFNKIRDDGTQNTYLKNKYMILNERTSKYDPLSSCLVDFKGRANVASVKNFQLVESTPAQVVTTDMLQIDADKDYILQMGKTTEDCFNMDYKHPLSLLQAFAICIARFDAKLSW